ncbi:MAG: hypothetical protein M2R45_03888 [Verrucomicrobia subdivision 3 bacterium]|nr:hypothetical protein [Limisphaerales bacterium]MCS1412591.1 hypothetical protein [Limisphaerales bacterium]
MPPENDRSSGIRRSGQSTLCSDSDASAEGRLRELRYAWERLADDCLRIATPMLPVIRRLRSGRETFFNQLIAAVKGWKDTRNDFSKAITFGGGSVLDHGAVLRSAGLADVLSFDVAWQQGDVAWGNFSTMHGRRSFFGTRKVLASLVANVD